MRLCQVSYVPWLYTQNQNMQRIARLQWSALPNIYITAHTHENIRLFPYLQFLSLCDTGNIYVILNIHITSLHTLNTHENIRHTWERKALSVFCNSFSYLRLCAYSAVPSPVWPFPCVTQGRGLQNMERVWCSYGLAMISGLLKNIGLFCTT